MWYVYEEDMVHVQDLPLDYIYWDARNPKILGDLHVIQLPLPGGVADEDSS
jgi:hypothetical protein